jgi:hypothetical protein
MAECYTSEGSGGWSHSCPFVGEWLSLVEHLVRDQGVGGSNPLSPTNPFNVRSGDIGNRTFRRHRLHFRPERVLQGLQGFFLQINVAEIVIHKADQPDSVVDFFDADGLSSKGYAEVDLLVVQAETSATGDHQRAVVERVVRLWDASIGTAGSRIDFDRALHGERFMRSFLIELF